MSEPHAHDPEHHALTEILRRAEAGDGHAADELLPLIYDELRRLAYAKLKRECPGQTLQPTALVHEAFLRVARGDQSFTGHRHFFAAVAEAMRRILVEQARQRQRRGPRAEILLDGDALLEPPDDRVLDVNVALERLEANDPRKGRIVELKYFCGLSNEETAMAMGLSLGTIEREWRFIRAYLRRALGRPGDT